MNINDMSIIVLKSNSATDHWFICLFTPQITKIDTILTYLIFILFTFFYFYPNLGEVQWTLAVN